MSYTIWPDGPTGDVLDLVNRERARQEELRRAGKFPFTPATPNGLTNSEKLAVLFEEAGEVAKHVVEERIDSARLSAKELREELIQVAAVCVAWAESL